MHGPIVVGTDGSATATEAVRKAIELAKSFEADLHVVSAYAPEHARVGGLPAEFDNAVTPDGRVDAILADSAARARAEGVVVKTHGLVGDAADAILGVAEDVGAELIVVGNKGISSLKRFVLGNVPSKVVHHSPCSTYVVHTT